MAKPETFTWFQDEAERQEHLDMIKDPSLWPKSTTSLLCLKHPERMGEEGSQDTAFGVITESGYNIHVGHGANRTMEYYDSAEAIIDAGWVVD